MELYILDLFTQVKHKAMENSFILMEIFLMEVGLKVMLKALATFIKKKVQCIKVCGLMINKMAKVWFSILFNSFLQVLKLGRTIHLMLEVILMEWNMVKGSLFEKMEVVMKVNSKTTLLMAMVKFSLYILT